MWWIYNTVLNRAGFESGYGSEAGNGFFFFMQMLFWIMILRNRFFFDFSLLNIFGTQSSEQLQKKNPTSCMFGSPFAFARIFFSPRNRASKMRERHQLFFGLRLLVSKEFHHLANCKQGSTLAESFHQSAPVMIGLSTCKPNLQ